MGFEFQVSNLEWKRQFASKPRNETNIVEELWIVIEKGMCGVRFLQWLLVPKWATL